MPTATITETQQLMAEWSAAHLFFYVQGVNGPEDYATAEVWLSHRDDLEVIWEDDPDGDHSYLDQEEFAGYEVETCEWCAIYDVASLNTYDRSTEILASLGCIDDATDIYRRVVEAELAMEAMANHA